VADFSPLNAPDRPARETEASRQRQRQRSDNIEATTAAKNISRRDLQAGNLSSRMAIVVHRNPDCKWVPVCRFVCGKTSLTDFGSTFAQKTPDAYDLSNVLSDRGESMSARRTAFECYAVKE